MAPGHGTDMIEEPKGEVRRGVRSARSLDPVLGAVGPLEENFGDLAPKVFGRRHPTSENALFQDLTPNIS